MYSSHSGLYCFFEHDSGMLVSEVYLMSSLSIVEYDGFLDSWVFICFSRE